MKRRILYGTLVGLLGANIFIGAQIYFSSVQGAEKDDAYPQLKLFSIVLDRVRNDYVDGGKLSYQELIHGALKGMLNTLDPHSEFMEPIKYEELKKDTQGEFGGVGIVISMKDNYITVVSPMDDTPGFKAGILSGDRIIKINNKSTEKIGLPEAVKMLRGEPGTDVSLSVLRPSSGVVKDYKLTRASIKVTRSKISPADGNFR
jgi:carboxyl-terminal processing protease